MLGILAALGAAVCSGLTPVILKRPSERYPAFLVNAVKLSAGLVAVTLLVVILDPGWLFHISPRAWFFGFLGAMLGPVAAWFFYLKAMKGMDVSLVSPGVNSYPPLAIFVDFLVYSIVPRPFSLVAALVILAGIWLLFMDSPKTMQTRKAWVFAGLTAACWGVNNVVFKTLAHEAPVLTAAWLRVFFASMVVIVVAMALHWRDIRRISRRDWGLIAMSGVTHDAGSAFLFISSLKLGQIYVVSPLASTSPLFAAVLSAIFLRERIGRFRWAGIFLTILGIILMSFLR
jgi:drug/metabolite transporter (DMT)-like permease